MSASDLSLDDALGRRAKGLKERGTVIHAAVQMSYAGDHMGIIDGFARPPHCAAIARHYREGTYAFRK
jgi:hypothetical protein